MDGWGRDGEKLAEMGGHWGEGGKAGGTWGKMSQIGGIGEKLGEEGPSGVISLLFWLDG